MGKFREYYIHKPTSMVCLSYETAEKFENDWFTVVEKAAFTEAAELIDELKKSLQEINEDALYSFIAQESAKALAKIKEFKEKGK